MKKILLSVVAIVVALGAQAQLLWKVSGNGLEKPSYVMGTHHVAPVTLMDSIAGFEKALESCDAVYGEIVKSEMNSPAAQQAIAVTAMAPADSTLNRVLTPAQYALVDSVLQQYTLGQARLEQFNAMKPSMVGVSIGMMQSFKAFPGFDPNKQLDTEVQSRAEKLGKRLGGLETVDFQVKLLFGNAISKQKDDLVKMAENDAKMATYAHRLAQAYREQNLNDLLALMEDPELGSTEEEMNQMIYDRNANWAKELGQLMPAESIFVCVGAGHLPGDKGLLALLRGMGYQVEPMTE